jgi:hypothetical protein
MYTRHTPTATTPITKIAVRKTMSAMTTLPSLLWLGHKLMPEILSFGDKALFYCAIVQTKKMIKHTRPTSSKNLSLPLMPAPFVTQQDCSHSQGEDRPNENGNLRNIHDHPPRRAGLTHRKFQVINAPAFTKLPEQH